MNFLQQYDRSVYKYLHNNLFWWTRVYPTARIFYSFISKWPRTEKTWFQIGEEHVNFITKYHRSGNTNETCQMLSERTKFVCQAYTYTWTGIWLYCAFVLPNG
ncbi:unnamed protein product [Cylicocyclus nassatus]|uniref:Uncharacterized protein n=1 Tax=Cylicocyclus nassatus TaxID=53992 RepID=A0AA36GT89_CYLNA|nr:unnamed protein product [Cylicocyclus nassatus]